MTDSSSLTLRRLLENSARQFAERPCLAGPGEAPLSYREVAESVRTLSHLLRAEGISFGDKVAIIGENCPQWGIAYFAIVCMGAVAVPILTEFHGEAIAHIIRHSEARAVFVSEKLFPKLEGAAFDPVPLCFNLETFSAMALDISRDTLRALKEAGLREFRRWTGKTLGESAPVEPSGEDLAAIIYTSGTTGHSKGVMLTHSNIVANTLAVFSIVPINREDRLLSILPLAHAFEATLGLICPLSRGASVNYLGKAPTARVLLPALEEVKPTIVLSVPLVVEKIFKNSILPKLSKTGFKRLLCRFALTRRLISRLAGKKLLAAFGGRIRVLAIGGAPLAADAERFLREARFPFAIGYGLTEASPLLTGTSPARTRPSSAGTVLEGVQLRLGAVHPQTGEGEIEVRGPNIMRGYYKLPEATAEVLSEDGWLRTGDLGIVNADGYVFIKGRSKNVIVGPSGENIYPEEVESLFFASPYVQEALVYSRAGRLSARVYLDVDRTEEYFAAHPERTMGDLLESIRLEVNARASSFSRIQMILEQTEPFEKTATQKIKRYLYVDI
ncbi:MAG: AMP-binding protein [Deltaproteobacteria bacterium]|jgi:long-chain acyl-CoA synthetase|nr:AMP-binding protein [Deltaproteobacteria bacterium]